jgi:hypothetical protein
MRLSDARVRRRKTKLIYTNHRLPQLLTGADISRDRSNRWLDPRRNRNSTLVIYDAISLRFEVHSLE